MAKIINVKPTWLDIKVKTRTFIRSCILVCAYNSLVVLQFGVSFSFLVQVPIYGTFILCYCSAITLFTHDLLVKNKRCQKVPLHCT